MMHRFAQPEWLLLLLLIPIIALLIGLRGRRPAVHFSSSALLRHALPARSRAGAWQTFFRSLALALLIIALARPQLGSSDHEQRSEGIDIVLALDLSLSMWTHDMMMNGELTDRWTIVRKVVREFIAKRPQDRIGIVAFSGDAYTASPLTLNHEWLLATMDRLKLNLIPEMGTNIGKALGVSLTRLDNKDFKDVHRNRIIVLLTDGDSNIVDKLTPKTGAHAAATLGVKVYTIGLGEEGTVLWPRFDQTYEPIRDSAGKIRLQRISSYINTESLEEIAQITGAKFFRAKDTATLETIYDEIDRMEKTEINLYEKINYNDIFLPFLITGFALLFIEWLLAQTLWRRLP